MSRNDVPAFLAARLNLQEDAAYAMLSDAVYASQELVAAARGQGGASLPERWWLLGTDAVQEGITPGHCDLLHVTEQSACQLRASHAAVCHTDENLANKRDLACL